MRVYIFFPFIFFVSLACTTTVADHHVIFQLTNGGSETLRCKIVYAHWVERDLGLIHSDLTLNIALRQQSADHAFFIYREDMQRRLMIENIVCGHEKDWKDSLGQIDLARLRQKNVTYFDVTCAAVKDARNVLCKLTDIVVKE